MGIMWGAGTAGNRPIGCHSTQPLAGLVEAVQKQQGRWRITKMLTSTLFRRKFKIAKTGAFPHPFRLHFRLFFSLSSSLINCCIQMRRRRVHLGGLDLGAGCGAGVLELKEALHAYLDQECQDAQEKLLGEMESMQITVREI